MIVLISYRPIDDGDFSYHPTTTDNSFNFLRRELPHSMLHSDHLDNLYDRWWLHALSLNLYFTLTIRLCTLTISLCILTISLCTLQSLGFIHTHISACLYDSLLELLQSIFVYLIIIFNLNLFTDEVILNNLFYHFLELGVGLTVILLKLMN